MMHILSKKLVTLFLTNAATLVALAAAAGAPCTNAAEVVPSDCRELGIFDVYDRLIPLTSDDVRGGAIQTVVVRFIPFDTPLQGELKVALHARLDGTIDMTLWRPNGISIQGQLRALRAQRDDRCDSELVEAISLERIELESDRAIRRLYSEFGRLRVSASSDPDIYLDSSRFEISVKGAMSANVFVRYAGRTPPISRDALTTWAMKLIETTNQTLARRRP
jgi:hypothetical protein